MDLHYTYSPTTDIGKVRRKIGDNPDTVDAVLTGSRDDWKCVQSDEEIQAALDEHGGDVLITSVALLYEIAGTEALLSAVIRGGDFDYDPSKKAAELRAQAASLLESSRLLDEGIGPAEAIVDQFGTEFAAREGIFRGVYPWP